MARVFISHSSRDAEPAKQMKAWLEAKGFDAPFLDFDKHAGIPPGADWERTLYREIDRSEAIIIIQTPNWMDSKWCFAECIQARALGKPIFPVIETPTGDRFILPDIQLLDLMLDREGGLDRLSGELTRIALDAQGGMPWDRTRPPFPGLMAFQEEDAAVYFGRDDDIRRLIERLNARRAQGGARLIALLGASGSGKSSLMRAGVIPRLKRAGRTWIVAPTMRPQARPVDQLARTLAVATDQGSEWRALRERLLTDDPTVVLGEIAFDLRVQHEATEAHILLPVDQAEELFSSADKTQAVRFLEILSAALAAEEHPILCLFAMRSDYLGALQGAEALTVRFEEFSLGPMPLARIPQIIEGPARVAGLGVEDQFVNQAALDAETEDALPLLAFALRELYDRYGADNHLSFEEYQALGDRGLTPLENAVRQRADEVLAEARPDDDTLAALRDAFVPAMVRVNDQGEYVRQPARFDALPARAHPLLERLAKARLLVLRQEDDGRMVEVTHEALLRKWPLLRDWLDEAREFLAGKRQLESYLADWQNAPEDEKEAALLSGIKLNRAQAWLSERPHQLSTDERALIQASLERRERDERRKLAAQRQRRNLFAGAFAITLVLLGLSAWQWQVAERQRSIASATAADLDGKILELLETLSIDQAMGIEGDPGPVVVEHEDWVTLLQDRRVNLGETESAQFLAARQYGRGRVMAAGHDGMINFCDPFLHDCDTPRGTDVQRFFLELVTGWLAFGNRERHDVGLGEGGDGSQNVVVRKISIGIATGHCEIIPDYYGPQGKLLVDILEKFPGFSVKKVSAPLSASQLTDVDVLIVGNAWGNIEIAEIDMVRQFVEDGGGLLATGLGWSWQQNLNEAFGRAACPQGQGMRIGLDPANMTTYPMNRLLAPFDASFSAE